MPVPPSQLCEREIDLLARAKQWRSHTQWIELTADALQEIGEQEGIDFATALLYTRLRESSKHGPVIHDIEQRVLLDEKHQNAGVRVAIVPGGCHEENSDSRECLRLVYREVTRLGFETEIIPTASFGSFADNARIIQSSLQSRSDLPIVVVSLSKGSAEVKWALREDPMLGQQIAGWIDVSGLLYGSEWVRWLLDRGISRLGARIWCWYLGYPFSTLEELRREVGSPMDFDLNLPEQLAVMHVVGFPLTGGLSHPYTRRSFQRLSARGPNDGMGFMLGDLQRASGAIYPVWNADHFLRPGDKDMRDFVGPVLDYVATQAKQSRGWSRNGVTDSQ